jgi:hypothetical protein
MPFDHGRFIADRRTEINRYTDEFRPDDFLSRADSGFLATICHISRGSPKRSYHSPGRSRDKIPQPGIEYVVEYRVTLFETDLPGQHMWRPLSGKHYRVLWTRNFRQITKCCF